MSRFILALDQGTTSSRAIVFGRDGRIVAVAQQEFPQIFPSPGHVEHDPEAIWSVAARRRARGARRGAGLTAPTSPPSASPTSARRRSSGTATPGSRSPTPSSGRAAISAPICERLEGRRPRADVPREDRPGPRRLFLRHEDQAPARHDAGPARARAERGEVLFGTVDSFLIWRLTGGKRARHRRTATPAARCCSTSTRSTGTTSCSTLLDVPRAMLPEVRPSSERLRRDRRVAASARAIPIAGDAGDQQAAHVRPGLLRAGRGEEHLRHRLLHAAEHRRHAGRLAEQAADDHRLAHRRRRPTYCLEGSVFIAGAVVQWLRDGLGIIEVSADVEQLAATVPDSDGVYFVPAFVGLGAPYWDPYARGAIVGITRGTDTRPHRPRRRRVDGLPDPRRARADAAGRRPRAWRRSRSTAAPRPTTR